MSLIPESLAFVARGTTELTISTNAFLLQSCQFLLFALYNAKLSNIYKIDNFLYRVLRNSLEMNEFSEFVFISEFPDFFVRLVIMDFRSLEVHYNETEVHYNET